MKKKKTARDIIIKYLFQIEEEYKNLRMQKNREIHAYNSDMLNEELSEYARNQWKSMYLPEYKGHEYRLTYFARSKKEIDKEILDILVGNEELKN